jgi:sugar phosphate isomerase/epimerase
MLLDEIDSPWLKVVIDPANLLRAGDFPRVEEILDEAFDWLGQDIVLAHAKDPATGRNPEETITIREFLETSQGRTNVLTLVLSELEEAGSVIHFPPETLARKFQRYLLDLRDFYFAYIERLNAIGFTGALVMHGMAEEELDAMQRRITRLIKDSRKDR